VPPLAALLLPALLAGGAAGQVPPPAVETLVVEAAARCRVEFNSTGFPAAVVFDDPEKSEAFTDRPLRLAGTAPRCRFADDDFAQSFAGDDPPNVAVSGWRKRRRKPRWTRAYAVVAFTSAAWDAAAKTLRLEVVQYPGQAGVTKGFGRGEGARAEALRFCAGFVDPPLADAGSTGQGGGGAVDKQQQQSLFNDGVRQICHQYGSSSIAALEGYLLVLG